ncbi:type VI secretion system tube protein Hcp [Lapillicoccus sp.]|uniref:type VI secretion system tube protein Hcp n=1 Tax=Lapillicoccus sp. TaxID=1909287 RepID=UPI0025E3D1D5|nr:type VI secretion system tube protein Hcp [Lapillicoccus sp.]
MSISMYLKIPGVTGGSTDVGFVGALTVLAFSWGASNPTVVVGGGGGAKPAIQDLSFTSYVDTATAPLTQKMLGGLTSTSAVLTLVTPTTGGGTTNDVYTLTTVLVSSVSLGGSGGEDRLTVNYSLNFGLLNFLISGKRVTWNLTTNTP